MDIKYIFMNSDTYQAFLYGILLINLVLKKRNERDFSRFL